MSEPTNEKIKFLLSIGRLFMSFSYDLQDIFDKDQIGAKELIYIKEYRQQITGVIKFLDILYNYKFFSEDEFYQLYPRAI